jgi:hypothetical protein
VEALREQVPEGTLRGITEAFHVSYERLPAPAQRAARLIALCSSEPMPMTLIEALGPQFPSSVRAVLVARSFVTPAPSGKVALFGTMHRCWQTSCAYYLSTSIMGLDISQPAPSARGVSTN